MSRDSERRADSQWLDEQNRKRIAMTREERLAEIEERKQLVSNVTAFAAKEGRELTDREVALIKRETSVVDSITLGLEND